MSLNLLWNSLTLDHGGLAGHPLHFDEARGRVRGVKNRRPCYQPVTPRANHFRGVVLLHPAVDLNLEVQPQLPAAPREIRHLLQRIWNELLSAEPRIDAHYKHV